MKNRTLLLGSLLGAILVLAVAAVPIANLVLQTDMNAGGHSITNVTSILDPSGNPITGGGSVTASAIEASQTNYLGLTNSMNVFYGAFHGDTFAGGGFTGNGTGLTNTQAGSFNLSGSNSISAQAAAASVGVLSNGANLFNGNIGQTTQSVVTVDAGIWLTNTFFAPNNTNWGYTQIAALAPADGAWTNMLAALSPITSIHQRIRVNLPLGVVRFTNAIEIPVGMDFYGHGYFHNAAYSGEEVSNAYTMLWQSNTNNDGIHVDADQGAPSLHNFEVCGRTNAAANMCNAAAGTGLTDPFYSPIPGTTNNSIYAKVGISIRGFASGQYCGGVILDNVVITGFKIGLWNEGNFEPFNHCQFVADDIGVINSGDLSPPSFPGSGWTGINLPLYMGLHDASLAGGAPDQVIFNQCSFGMRSNGVCIVNGSGGVVIYSTSDINFKTYGIIYGAHELTVIGGHSEPDQYIGTNFIMGFDGPGNSIITRNWDIVNASNFGSNNIYGDTLTNFSLWYDPVNSFRRISMDGRLQGIPANSVTTFVGANPFAATAQGDFQYNYPLSSMLANNNYYSGLNSFSNQVVIQNGQNNGNATLIGGDANTFNLTSGASLHYFELRFPYQGQTTFNQVPLEMDSGSGYAELSFGGTTASQAAVGFNQINWYLSSGGGSPVQSLIMQGGTTVNFGSLVGATLGSSTYPWSSFVGTNHVAYGTGGGYVVKTNAWILANETNGMVNGDGKFASSNGYPVWIQINNGSANIYNLTTSGGGIIP